MVQYICGPHCELVRGRYRGIDRFRDSHWAKVSDWVRGMDWVT